MSTSKRTTVKDKTASEQRPRLTFAAVNDALAKIGAKERLVKGNGYLYFTGGGAANWSSCSVMVPRLSDYTLDEWLIVWRNMRSEAARQLEYSFTGTW
ncbi:hypothetical protein [Pseudomonas serbica]|jgi:hypothetical protein|uniref:hypothetical protein n=1 Tax=Pseudomonas serbica TaxID=2965074 RepID=UPI00237AA3FA|nr:hypothetical protein [Pseudomonas serbica]